MTTINLKDFYYWYTQDQLIEVSDEVAAAVQFVRSGWRRRAVIASLEQAPAAMRGESGTRIVP